MHTRRTRNAVAAVLAGVLMAMASSTIAHAQSLQSSDPTPVTSSSIQSIPIPATPERIQNYNSGLYLTPTGGAVGSDVVQWSYLSHTGQKWFLVVDGSYFSFYNEGYVKNMGVAHASTSPGAHAIIATPDGNFNQDWDVNTRSDMSPYFELKNRKSGLCLGIGGASRSPGAYAQQFACDGRANQTWRFV